MWWISEPGKLKTLRNISEYFKVEAHEWTCNEECDGNDTIHMEIEKDDTGANQQKIENKMDRNTRNSRILNFDEAVVSTLISGRYLFL